MMKTAETAYRNPGTGAIEFARQYTEGLTVKEALPVIERLLKGELHDPADKRIKRCAYCGYYYRDKTRPNNSKTCSRECKIANDTLKRAKKRADAALLKPEKKTEVREEHYTWWLEYPFWINEYEMLKRSWKYQVPYAPDKLAQIDAAKQRDRMIGGKRKPKLIPSDDGNKTIVKFVKSDRKLGEVIVSHMNI
ncbi:hypothetical protein [Heyndrickxia coagulans]|uniref:Uncharacterized protein n=1 Tax=Heyndrickxia coagulans TaxID=1398 RepID=A0A150K8F5_HEYCO|nr:hypothetical protein [Heyndrickxia coagulans]KYC65204.1 hypothetical protein B4099_0350 [Heyndrickxia coagulans]